MNDKAEIELLKMKHAHAVADLHRFAACANRETAMGGWIVDWEEAMSFASGTANECEEQIEARMRERRGIGGSSGIDAARKEQP